MQTEKDRSRMKASSAGKHGYGDKGRWVKYWARLGCWISPWYGPFLLCTPFETYEPFISLIFNFFFLSVVKSGYWISGYGGTTVFLYQHFMRTCWSLEDGTNRLQQKLALALYAFIFLSHLRAQRFVGCWFDCHSSVRWTTKVLLTE
jgi:hypothetical protein